MIKKIGCVKVFLDGCHLEKAAAVEFVSALAGSQVKCLNMKYSKRSEGDLNKLAEALLFTSIIEMEVKEYDIAEEPVQVVNALRENSFKKFGVTSKALQFSLQQDPANEKQEEKSSLIVASTPVSLNSTTLPSFLISNVNNEAKGSEDKKVAEVTEGLKKISLTTLQFARSLAVVKKTRKKDSSKNALINDGLR